MPPVSAAVDGVLTDAVDLVGDRVVLDRLDAPRPPPGRSSRTTISRPLLRKAYSRIRAVIVSREYVVVSKMSGEAQ